MGNVGVEAGVYPLASCLGCFLSGFLAMFMKDLNCKFGFLSIGVLSGSTLTTAKASGSGHAAVCQVFRPRQCWVQPPASRCSGGSWAQQGSGFRALGLRVSGLEFWRFGGSGKIC